MATDRTGAGDLATVVQRATESHARRADREGSVVPLRAENHHRRSGAAGTTALHVLQVFQPSTGGIPRYVHSLADGLLERGWRVSVACPGDARGFERFAAAGIEVVPIDVRSSPSPWRDGRAARALAAWSREHEVSLVHGHGAKAGMLVALTGRSAKIPSIYTAHGWSFEQPVSSVRRAAYALLERQLARHFHASILAVSGFDRTAAERSRVAPPGRLQVIRTGVVPVPAIARSVARRTVGIAQDAVVAAWIGEVGRHKQPEHLARISRGLAGAVEVVALCDGLHGTPLARELHDAGVRIVDPGCDPAVVYAAADMLLHTSAWDACPLVVLEAMSAKLPVIAYDVGGVAEQIRAGRTGFLVGAGDIEMVCECALALSRDAYRRAAMGEAGYRLAGELFDYDSMLEKTVRSYAAAVPESPEVVMPPPSPAHRPPYPLRPARNR